MAWAQRVNSYHGQLMILPITHSVCIVTYYILITYSDYIVCRLSYPAYKDHAPYYIVTFGLWLYHVFPHYFTKGMIFGKKGFEHKSFDFLYKFV
jgi:hypothetical protein